MLERCVIELVLLTYDTTFQLGDFYVTTLVVQLGSFTEKPMLHERKFKLLHEESCKKIRGLLPSTVALHALHICTDCESGCYNALWQVFLQWNVYNC